MASRGPNAKFVPRFDEQSKTNLRLRIQKSPSNWVAFQSIREMLRCMYGLSTRDAWLSAAKFFPKGQRTYTDEEVQAVRAQVVEEYAGRLPDAPIEGSTFYGPGAGLSIRAREALHRRPIGKGKFADEEINWVMAKMEEKTIDVSDLPFQRTLSIWTFARRAPDDFHKVYAIKLMPKADRTAADEKRLVDVEKKEAQDATEMHGQLVELLGATAATDDDPSHF